MMSGVSAMPEPPRPQVVSPTAPLPLLKGRKRHRATDDGRRLMLLTVAGAVVAVVAAAVMVASVGDEDGDGAARSGPAAALAGTPEAPEPAVADEPSASPTASPSPSPKPSSPRPARPADLLSGLRATVRGLVEQGQLSRDAGEELNKRLREAEEELADGDARKARKKLSEFAQKLVDLRKENKISSAGYDVLIAGATQLAQALPDR